MQKLTNHYQQLLGLPVTWEVENVDFSLTAQSPFQPIIYPPIKEQLGKFDAV